MIAPKSPRLSSSDACIRRSVELARYNMELLA